MFQKSQNLYYVGLTNMTMHQRARGCYDPVADLVFDHDLVYLPSRLDTSILYDCLHKYDIDYALVPDRAVQCIYRAMRIVSHVYDCVRGKELCSFDECLVHLTKHSSPGHPLRTVFKKRSDVLMDDNSLNHLKNWFGKFGATLWPRTCWTCFLKDELRKVKKVLEGNTRMILSSEIILNLICCKYFHNQIEIMHMHSIDKPISVGITLFFQGWEQLYNRLTRGRTDGVWYCLDFRNWDQHLRSFLLQCCKQLRKGWLGNLTKSEEADIDALYEEICNALIVGPNGELIVKFEGQNSGSPLTADDNSLCQLLLLYGSLCYKFPDLTDEEITKVVEPAVYGDDNTMVSFNSDYTSQDYADFALLFGEIIKNETLPATDKPHYLNGFFHKLPYGGVDRIIYLPVDRKIFDSLRFNACPNPVDQLSSVVSLMALYTGDEEIWRQLYKYGVTLIKRFGTLLNDDPVWLAACEQVEKPWAWFLLRHIGVPL